MIFRAKRTSENMAIALFAGVILYLAAAIVLSDIDFENQNVKKLLDMLSLSLRLLIPSSIFVYMQKRLGFEAIKIKTAAVRESVLWALLGFCMVFVLGLLYSMAFPAAAVAYYDKGVLAVLLSVCAHALLPALTEENLYRRLFCRELTIYGNTFAVIISALIFALTHYSFYTFPYTFICGLIIGFVYVKTGSVKYTVAIHFANNLSAYVLGMVTRSMSRSDADKLLFLLIMVLCVAALAAFYFLSPSYDDSFSGRKNGQASSSAFLTFPMVIFIFCAVIMNFI